MAVRENLVNLAVDGAKAGGGSNLTVYGLLEASAFLLALVAGAILLYRLYPKIVEVLG